MTKASFLATIEWLTLEAGGRQSPPSGDGGRYSAPARFGEWVGNQPASADFSLVAILEEKLDPYHWKARVMFLFDDAPHDRLRPGAKFEFYEGRRCVARGTVIG